MQKLTEHLVTLALQPSWDNTAPKMAAEIQQMLTENEQALLKEKIICFIYTPDPEEPEQQVPEQPEQPEPEEDVSAPSIKRAG